MKRLLFPEPKTSIYILLIRTKITWTRCIARIYNVCCTAISVCVCVFPGCCSGTHLQGRISVNKSRWDWDGSGLTHQSPTGTSCLSANHTTLTSCFKQLWQWSKLWVDLYIIIKKKKRKQTFNTCVCVCVGGESRAAHPAVSDPHFWDVYELRAQHLSLCCVIWHWR